MKIKLKAGSSVNIVNQSGNTIVKINEDGTVEGLSGGTKLYKHYLHDSSSGYKFILITTNPEPIDFSSFDSYQKLHDYLMSQNVIRFTTDFGNTVQYKPVANNCFYAIDNDGAGAPALGEFDDWILATTTDTVTSL